ncbi:uncharacterized protein LOC110979374 [Acanthaster planci]|uniref:Uncharacterized protein LOC110979374 n=1 Tax=Acanthaster planci TaxID=133434 RepID=A0A8B7YGN7_ACAPL|nr:uncharacterized protein LOC110979374 [Acanthaster planci]
MKNEGMSDMSSNASNASSMDDGEDDFPVAAKHDYRRGKGKARPSWRKHGKTAPEFTGHTGATHSEEWTDFTPMQIFQLFFSQVVWELLVTANVMLSVTEKLPDRATQVIGLQQPLQK